MAVKDSSVWNVGARRAVPLGLNVETGHGTPFPYGRNVRTINAGSLATVILVDHDAFSHPSNVPSFPSTSSSASGAMTSAFFACRARQSRLLT